MDWTAQFDAYCERTDLTLWSEPINAVTNLAFLIAAIIMWRRTKGVAGAKVLCCILFIIGIGSALFHTLATGWAAMADNIPIGLYILTYLYLVNRRVLRLSLVWAVVGTVMFIPYAALMVPVLDRIPFVGISNFYWTVPILLVIYAYGLRHKYPQLARGFVQGALLLCVSISVRSLDAILCNSVPIGTHFVWHLLNATMLGYMIHVYSTHVLAGDKTGR